MQNHILSTDELADIISKKISEKFPDKDSFVFRFRQCQKNFSPGGYVYSKGRKYYITEINERGNMATVLETVDFDDLFYNVLEILFINMYGRNPNEKRRPNILRNNVIVRLFVNCWVMRRLRCIKIDRSPDSRRKMFEQKLEWFGLFGDYYQQRAQKEIDEILSNFPYKDSMKNSSI